MYSLFAHVSRTTGLLVFLPPPQHHACTKHNTRTMPPKISARGQDDKPDGPTTKERPSASSAKMRRNASQTSNNQPREAPTSAPTSAPAPGLSDPAPPTVSSLDLPQTSCPLHVQSRSAPLPAPPSHDIKADFAFPVSTRSPGPPSHETPCTPTDENTPYHPRRPL